MYKWLISSFILIFSLYYFLFLQDDLDLSPNNLKNSAWEVSTTAEDKAKINLILNQPFTYLSEGGQSYVFVSQDQKYVLKLFKFNRFKPHFLVQLLPDIFPFKTYKEKHTKKRENKLITAFNGYKLAYDLHKEESALIALQLIPSHGTTWITVVDKKNRLKKINLETVPYILQEKGEMLSFELSNLLKSSNLSLTKIRLTEVLQLYLLEYQKGISDLDHGVMHNIGCIEERIFHLDGGKFIFDHKIKDPKAYAEDLIKVASKLQAWVSKEAKEHSYELTKHLENRLFDLGIDHLFSSFLNPKIKDFILNYPLFKELELHESFVQKLREMITLEETHIVDLVNWLFLELDLKPEYQAFFYRYADKPNGVDFLTYLQEARKKLKEHPKFSGKAKKPSFEDQFLEGNLPSFIAHINDKTKLIRIGQPLCETPHLLSSWFSSFKISPEFLLFIKNQPKHLYVNLMKRTGVEGPMTKGLEELENECKNLHVITLDKNSSFYWQNDQEYSEILESLRFKEMFLEQMSACKGNYFWSSHLNPSSWKEELHELLNRLIPYKSIIV